MNKIGDFLKNNPYPGRGIVIGKSQNSVCLAYFLMGRSQNSRNRILVEEKGELLTRAFDESKVEDPSLIIYSPIKIFENQIIVSNGDQTDTIYDGLKKGTEFEKSLETREFEPDAPNFTPRISGLIQLKNLTTTSKTDFYDKTFSYKLSILKKTDVEGSACNRFTYAYAPIKNTGHFIHTYLNEPTISFKGEPMEIEISDDINAFAEEIWENLDFDNKISLYVKYLNLNDGNAQKILINKNE